MADGGGLENRYGVTPIVGSNPTPSAQRSTFVALCAQVGHAACRRDDTPSGTDLSVPISAGLFTPRKTSPSVTPPSPGAQPTSPVTGDGNRPNPRSRSFEESSVRRRGGRPDRGRPGDRRQCRTGGGPGPGGHPSRAHDLSSPLSDKQRALRQAASRRSCAGEATPRGTTRSSRSSKGQYVELAQEDSDAIWTVLGEFSDREAQRRSRARTGWWTTPRSGRDDFSQAHSKAALPLDAAGVNSVPNFYEELSSGRYTVTGEVEDWVGVPGTGRLTTATTTAATRRATWVFVNDTLNAWYQQQLDCGQDRRPDRRLPLAVRRLGPLRPRRRRRTSTRPTATSTTSRPCTRAWARRSAAAPGRRRHLVAPLVQPVQRRSAPAARRSDGSRSRSAAPRSATSNYWVGDYTVEPENGGVGVFAHEFGHDLGLPDLYDTSGNTGGAENSTGFWTLMCSGSYGNNGHPEDGIGTEPDPHGRLGEAAARLARLRGLRRPARRPSTKLGPSTPTPSRRRRHRRPAGQAVHREHRHAVRRAPTSGTPARATTWTTPC